jgi:hypothetical protein
MFVYYAQKWAQLLAIKKARSMPNGKTCKKIHNSFKYIYLNDFLAGLFDEELGLKGNNFTNASKNCFSL